MINSVARLALVNLLPNDLFSPDISIARSRVLFKSFVKLVEVESHAYCNRVCWFCPNSTLDRRSAINPASDGLYEKIISDLARISYNQTLVWARYHEPMATDAIYEKVRYARDRLPLAFLTMHTNGDYLNPKSAKKLEAVGLDQLRINLYVANGHEYNAESVAAMIGQLEKRSGGTVVTNSANGERELAGFSFNCPIHIPNFSAGYSLRAGAIEDDAHKASAPRISACLSPLQHLNVDFNGSGMLCCQTRSDAPGHKTAIIGDLSQPDYSLFHFFRDLADARRHLVSGGPKDGVCRDCRQNEGGPHRFGRVGLAKIVSRLPFVEYNLSRAWSKQRRYDPTAEL